MTWRYRMRGTMTPEMRAAHVWIGSLGPLLWAVTRGDWVWVHDLPRMP